MRPEIDLHWTLWAGGVQQYGRSQTVYAGLDDPARYGVLSDLFGQSRILSA